MGLSPYQASIINKIFCQVENPSEDLYGTAQFAKLKLLRCSQFSPKSLVIYETSDNELSLLFQCANKGNHLPDLFFGQHTFPRDHGRSRFTFIDTPE